MSRVSRVLIGVLAVLALLVLALALFLIFSARRSFPQVDGQVQLAGLQETVEVVRDSRGIPHIYASNSHDLFFAQGYVHAQDRFFQMDFWRHVGTARLSEMFGPGQAGADRFLRTLGWARIAEEEWAQADPELRAILEAYAGGVNAYLQDRRGSAISLEYLVLGLLSPDYQPEPWTPIHTMAFAKLQAWNLGSSELDAKIERAVLLDSLTPEQMADLTPPYPDDHPVIVRQPVAADARPASAGLPAPLPDKKALSALRARVAGLDALLGAGGEGLGSNSWVISGDLTDTGLPYLADDPHLGAQMPSIWYEVGLHCQPVGETCPYNVVGFSFASAPGVVIGHNERIAWGFTNLGPDVMDLYIERINPQNPNQYEVDGEWVDMTLVEETLQLGGESETLQMRYTRHGPIISETYGALEDLDQRAGIDLPEAYALALRWTALEPGKTLQAILGFNVAQNWEEFRSAARDFSVPSQNLVYADVDGNIGYQAPGWIPIRLPGHNPDLPVPGWTDDYEWQGYIPFESLPSAYNPPEGYLVTANNAVVGPEYPYTLANYWAYGYRGRRIVDMIEGADRPITMEAIRAMQGDDMDLNAETLVPIVLDLTFTDARLVEAQGMLDGWDYQSHMDSAAAGLFQVFWKNLLAETFHDDLPEEAWPGGGSRWFEVVRNLVGEPESSWWDDQETAEIETRDEIFARAFTAAVLELEESLGSRPEAWRWGDLHTLTFENQTLGQSGVAPIEALFNRGPYRTSGGSSIVNATGWWTLSGGYHVLSLPSMRMIVDLDDLSRSLAIHPTGQSGHAYHPHYVDMADTWRMIQYHSMLWSREAVLADAEGVLDLVP